MSSVSRILAARCRTSRRDTTIRSLRADLHRRVGSLSSGVSTGTTNALSDALQALGYIEGKMIILEFRYAEGRADRLPTLAAEIVQLNADVIVAWGVEPLEAVRRATTRT
jgi:putative ABC transport system substrate-binding protein